MTLPPVGIEKKHCKEKLKSHRKDLFELQNVFAASAQFGLLIIFQGMDSAGKDSSIRKVFSCMNPAGIRVKSFKKPTEDEQKHDFLWRVYPHFPAKGEIAIFNRSYYEDLLVPEIQGTLSNSLKTHRANLLNELENHLLLNGTHIIKFYLNLDAKEQHKRINSRLTRLDKKWKYTPADLLAIEQYDTTKAAYKMVIEACNVIPWINVPSDKKWYRNYYVAKTVRDYMHSLELSYPS